MGQIERDYEVHPLWGAIDQLKALLDGAPEVDVADAVEHLARLRWLHEQLLTVRPRAPWTVPASTLNNVKAALDGVNSTLATWIANPGEWPTYLTPAAMGYADAVLTHLATLPPVPEADVRAAEAGAQEAIRRSTESLTALRSTVVELEAQIEAQKQASAAATQEQAAATQGAVATVQQQQQTLSDQLATLSTTVTEQSTRLDSALTTHQTAFEASQTARTKFFEEQSEQVTKDAAVLAKSLSAKADDARRGQVEKAGTHLDRLAELQEQAEAVVQTTGRRAITTEYGQYARGERRSAFWWSVAAVFLALGGFVFVVIELHDQNQTGLSWKLTALKFAGSLALLGVAGYAGKQAAEHRAQERDAKRTQLDINAVEPFLTRLPEQKQDELRADIAERVFGHRSNTTEHGEAPMLPVDNSFAALIGKGIKAFAENG